MPLILTALKGIPLIQPGDNLPAIILGALNTTGIDLKDGDILILAQKIVSKAEGRIVNLTTVIPSQHAIDLAIQTGKDPRLLELILQESKEVLRVRQGLIIVEHRLGFVCANAGIDHSNVKGQWGDHEDWVLLLPKDPDKSARECREKFQLETGKTLGVMIIDTHGRAWRLGTLGVCIGLSGLPGIVDLRGRLDLFNYELKYTEVGVADELAAAGSLLMGQVDERTPVVHVSGFPYPLREASLKELLRPKEKDLFR